MSFPVLTVDVTDLGETVCPAHEKCYNLMRATTLGVGDNFSKLLCDVAGGMDSNETVLSAHLQDVLGKNHSAAYKHTLTASHPVIGALESFSRNAYVRDVQARTVHTKQA